MKFEKIFGTLLLKNPFEIMYLFKCVLAYKLYDFFFEYVSKIELLNVFTVICMEK